MTSGTAIAVTFATRSFESKTDLETHQKTEHFHRCSHCLRVFNILNDLRDHHNTRVHCLCPTSDLLFVQRKRLARHIRLTVPVTKFRCLECEGDFVAGGALVHRPQREQSEYHTAPAPSALKVKSVEDTSLESGISGRDSSYLKELERHFANLNLNPVSPLIPLHHVGSGILDSSLDQKEADQLVREHHTENLRDLNTLATQEPSLIGVATNDETSPVMSDRSTLSSYHTAIESGHGSSMGAPSEDFSAGISPFSSAQPSPAKLAHNVSASSPIQLNTTRLFSLSCPQCRQHTDSFSTIKALHEHLPSHIPESKIFGYLSDLRTSDMKSRSGKNTEVLSKNFLITLQALKQNMDISKCGEKLDGIVEFVEEQLEELGFEGLKLLE
ncbi:MAG: hypothetical protein Q9208_001965 [Pyrenodesmia sp. 3 TL-2023]